MTDQGCDFDARSVMMTLMNKHFKILNLGQMAPHAGAAFEYRFAIYHSDVLRLANILPVHGKEVVAIVTSNWLRIAVALIERWAKLTVISKFGVGYDSIGGLSTRYCDSQQLSDELDDKMVDCTVGLRIATTQNLLTRRRVR
jgi:hypothetical protein